MENMKSGEMNIIMPEFDEINRYEDIKNDFLENILDIKPEDCFMSDEATLSDFSLAGMPDNVSNRADSMEAMYSLWDQWVMFAVMRRYGIIVKDPHESMVSIFSRIDDRFSRTATAPTQH